MKVKKCLSLILMAVIILTSSTLVIAFNGEEGFEDDENIPFENEENLPFEDEGEAVLVRGEVLQASEPTEGEKYWEQGVQNLRVRITEGEFEGQEFELEHMLFGVHTLELSAGDRVMVYIETTDGEITTIGVDEIIRDHIIYILLVIFVIILVAIGGLKGVKALVTLVLMGLAVIYVILPLMMEGFNPLILTVAFSIVVAIFTLLIIGGVNHKSFAAILGTATGLFLAGILAWVFANAANLTGYVSEEAQMLQFIDEGVDFDVRGLLLAGIIIGALGAILDVTMSIASAIEEIKMANPKLKAAELFSAGMNVGRDIMGTMVNTLILAYTGSALPLLLLFKAYEQPMSAIINSDLIATEIIRAIVGSMGLIVAIPFTALFAAFIHHKKG
ncbi:YibE/F family protein [Proteinivorax hydrogeniformans]|uniref:YibE/F family protein n=1 Tax=Proteinivorax hydrogeniformans TaxID=1826727 RepID=A0AAU8HTG4_9FIRM